MSRAPPARAPRARVHRLTGKQARAPALDDAGHRVPCEQAAIFGRQERDGIDDRREENTDLHDERYRVFYVAIADVERREEHADAESQQEDQAYEQRAQQQRPPGYHAIVAHHQDKEGRADCQIEQAR
jgi:hypothetical protein